jgi:lipopolysaccharide cholinephosphotransferase
LNSIQEKLFYMLKWFHEYCMREGIQYYAIGGTMIGAIRHQGFIPWDDDIDIAIPRGDYNKLIRTFTNIIDGYVLESPYSGNPDFLYSYAKLYDTSTTLVERTRVPCKRGVYIDVFPLDGIGNNIEEAERAFKKVDRKNMFLMARTCVIQDDRSWYKNASIILARAVPSFALDDKKLSISVDKTASHINDESSVYVANMMGAYRYREITLREYFGKPTLYPFEGVKIFGPEKYDEYLSGIYSNWRELPPVEKRYTKHDLVTLDLEKSYLNS